MKINIKLFEIIDEKNIMIYEEHDKIWGSVQGRNVLY